MDTTSQLQLEQQLREARRAEIERRVAAHNLEVDRVTSGAARRTTLGLAPAKRPLDFLAVGDSWFDYPLNDDGFYLPFHNAAIVGDSQLQAMGNPQPLVLNYAVHGQATTAMLSWENQQRILQALTNRSTHRGSNGTTAEGILVSAGGDDIVGDQFAIYLDYHGGGLNAARFQGVLASVQASYMDLFALRDIAAAEVNVDPAKIPIIGHCYDYAVPDGRPAGVGPLTFGPWLQPPLQFCGYGYDPDGLKIVKDAIDSFNKLLNDLATDKTTLAGKTTNNFILVNTIGTLIRNATRPNGWANEIHPYTAGFNALANRFLVALQKHFPGRI